MKKMVLVFALAAIALSGSAFAQDPAYFDNIGIYLDEAGTNSCEALPIGPVSAYLVLTKLTSSEVLAWEAKITTQDLFITSFSPRGDAVDVANRADEHIVGLATALPVVGGVCVIADLQLFVPDDGQALGIPAMGMAFVDEVYFSLQEDGLPAYLDGASNGVSLHPANSYNPSYLGSVDVPIFIANGDCDVVATDDVSFGSVKSLFR